MSLPTEAEPNGLTSPQRLNPVVQIESLCGGVKPAQYYCSKVITIGDDDGLDIDFSSLDFTFSLVTYYVALNHSKFLSWANSSFSPPISHLADFTIWVMTILGYIGLAIWAIIIIVLILAAILLVPVGILELID